LKFYRKKLWAKATIFIPLLLGVTGLPIQAQVPAIPNAPSADYFDAGYAALKNNKDTRTDPSSVRTDRTDVRTESRTDVGIGFGTDTRDDNRDLGDNIRNYHRDLSNNVRDYNRNLDNNIRDYNRDLGNNVRDYNRDLVNNIRDSNRDIINNAKSYEPPLPSRAVSGLDLPGLDLPERVIPSRTLPAGVVIPEIRIP
jgi:hypothetical protein